LGAFDLVLGGAMHGQEKRMLLRHHLGQGVSKRALARELGVSRDTIHRWIRDGELDRDVDLDPPRYGPRPPVPTKLDPYKAIIQTRLEAYPELSAVRLMEEICAAGYPGSYTQLKVYIRRVRPRAPEAPVVRFETPPDRQAQVDFADFKFPWGKRYGLLVVLGYSRLLWLRFFMRKDMRCLIAGLEEAFAFFGGVPRELLFDQMKSVITKDERLIGRDLAHNLEFLRFANHWGFSVRACRPYRAQTKGKVERPVSYVRKNFIYGREFLNDADLDDQRERWLTRTANVRMHWTTKERPQIRFERDEKALLQPLALRPYHSLLLTKPRLPGDSLLQASVPSELLVERRSLAAYAELAGGVR
jgi:transposase